jgi:hypothetical protein
MTLWAILKPQIVFSDLLPTKTSSAHFSRSVLGLTVLSKQAAKRMVRFGKSFWQRAAAQTVILIRITKNYLSETH